MTPSPLTVYLAAVESTVPSAKTQRLVRLLRVATEELERIEQIGLGIEARKARLALAELNRLATEEE